MPVKPAIELPLLAAIWGASFLLMKIGVPEFGAVLFMTLRTVVASAFLLTLLMLKKQCASLTKDKLHLFIAGSLNTAIPFVLFGWATLTLTAGSTSVLNGTTPMFGAIVSFFWLKDKLTVSQTIGLLVGFIGVYVLMMDKFSLPDSHVLLPTLAVLTATLCYGISANYTKKYLSHLKPLTLAAGSQLAASISLLPISLFFLPSAVPSSNAMISALVIGVVCTGIAYIIFFRLINDLGPTKAISVTYLIPAFGLLWGYIFLNEQISQTMLFGCGLILLGIALTTGAIKLNKRLKKAPT